jgi:hypothetical protein
VFLRYRRLSDINKALALRWPVEQGMRREIMYGQRTVDLLRRHRVAIIFIIAVESA